MSDEKKVWVLLREYEGFDAGTVVWKVKGTGLDRFCLPNGTHHDNNGEVALIQPPPKPEKAPEGYEFTGRLVKPPCKEAWLSRAWSNDENDRPVVDPMYTCAEEFYSGWRWELRKVQEKQRPHPNAEYQFPSVPTQFPDVPSVSLQDAIGGVLGCTTMEERLLEALAASQRARYEELGRVGGGAVRSGMDFIELQHIISKTHEEIRKASPGSPEEAMFREQLKGLLAEMMGGWEVSDALKIGDKVKFIKKKRSGKSIELTTHEGRCVALRTVRQMGVITSSGKHEWVDLEELERAEK